MTLEEAIDYYLESESRFRALGLELCAAEQAQIRLWLVELQDRREAERRHRPTTADPGGLY